MSPTSTDATAPTPPLMQRAGACAALVEGAAYIIGIVLFAAYLLPQGFTDSADDPAATMAFMLDHRVLLYVWTFVIYLIAAAALVVLSLALTERFRPTSPALAQVGSAFGIIWSAVLFISGMIALVGQGAVADLVVADQNAAVQLWAAVSTIHDATGGDIEIVGVIWILIISLTGLRSTRLPKALSILGIVVGIAGTATFVPVIADVGAVFGLGFIIWYFWVAIVLWRTDTADTSMQETR